MATWSHTASLTRSFTNGLVLISPAPVASATTVKPVAYREMTYSMRSTVTDGGSPRILIKAGSRYVGPSMATAAKTWMNIRNLYTDPPVGLGEAGPAQGLGRFGQEPHDERPEVRVHGRDLVEAHLVEDLLEGGGVVGQQGHAPLPIVEGEGAGDELQDPAGVGHADPGVTAHQPAPLLERELVPVGRSLAALGHRVEADQLLAGQARVELVLPVLGHPGPPGLEAGLDGGLVEPLAVRRQPLPLLLLGARVLRRLGEGDE